MAARQQAAPETADRQAGRRIRVTWKKSAIGYPEDQAATIRSLGLRRLNQTVTLPDTLVFRGMVRKVAHLVVVEEETR